MVEPCHDTITIVTSFKLVAPIVDKWSLVIVVKFHDSDISFKICYGKHASWALLDLKAFIFATYRWL